MIKPVVAYLHDDAVDVLIDADIRALLTCCFTKPQDAVFHHRRYFVEPYPHRWLVRNEQEQLIAHAGVHEKTIMVGSAIYGIGGVAEVCVHPSCRRQGLVKEVLHAIHTWMLGRECAFSVLMGDPRVYQSSGYRSVDNLYCDAGAGGTRQRCESAMVRPLKHIPWPDGDVYVPGPSF